ncbi:MAG: primosomal protein N' [Chlorobi bacterium]|nr:primosomal protein N' [Chlorobiota bacterium]MCI0715968.1 primosomal protein N' [Chlorobiota bacterium]
MKKNLANIAFNLPIDSLFTYLIPKSLPEEVHIGSRVLVPFGKRNTTGVVIELPEKSAYKKLKPVIEVLDAQPIISEEMISFCRWIAKYYICPIGEVIFSAVPKGILVESKILFSFNTEITTNGLTEHQKAVIELLKSKPLTIKQIEHRLKSKSSRSAVQSLLNKGILTQQHVTSKEKIKPKYEKYVVFELGEEFADYTNSMLNIFMKENNIKSSCQTKMLRYLVNKNVSEISSSELLKATGATSYSLNSLAKKEIVSLAKKQVTRDVEHEFSEEAKVVELNQEQKTVLSEINSAADKNEFITFLLFGVTGSGKTQVYIEAIQNVLKQNKTSIVLVPEISLTPQLIHRFRTYFGNIIGVIHSRLSEGQRFDVYQRIKSGEIKIVIGARSALFAPLSNIGIIIIDEEHDHSYKQTEKNPKYNARDSAIVRAKSNNAVVVLGSATPSLESFYNYKARKYTLLELPHRALKTKPPNVEIVSMLEEFKQPSKFQKWESADIRFLSSKLISYIDSALKNKQSIILLQNRRGYSAYQECQNCGYVKMCKNCDITMIYHKLKNHLRCHYCGSVEKLVEKCEKCGSENLMLKGTGTEKVEEEIARLFPKAKIKRMDADTVKRKDAHRKILKSFHEREFDILIGTQMISKGLDFPSVSLVGVVSADVGLLNPDFRSNERTFQLLSQVSGRSGRTTDYGKVVIQTMHTDNFIFPYVENHNYSGFFEKEINHRRTFNYPPFSRMSLIEVKSNNQTRANTIASKIYLFMKIHLLSLNGNAGVEIMKPAPALIYKVKNKYRFHIIVKSLKSSGESAGVTETMLKELEKFLEPKSGKLKFKSGEFVSIDVDPLSFY